MNFPPNADFWVAVALGIAAVAGFLTGLALWYWKGWAWWYALIGLVAFPAALFGFLVLALISWLR